MAININYFLKQKYEENTPTEELKTEELYNDVSNIYLKRLFALMHQSFNNLFEFMYKKSKSNHHYNAEESRQLLYYIKLYSDMRYVLKESALAFEIDENYEKLINQCIFFLTDSGGSEIPEDLINIMIVKYEPIFKLSRTVKVLSKTDEKRYPIKLIGEGSYALVFEYTDQFYNKKVIIKQAKKELNDKELKRFKKEYLIMNDLNSPYILEVYSYDDKKNEYYAEYMDDTLDKFISKNNDKLTIEQRINITFQIFKAFNYIHSKDLLHRDISLTNVLIKKYDHTIIAKISDFGLVKEKNSTLTSTESAVKGSLNDSQLDIIGFNNYSMVYETYALTRLILFVMTGKTNIDKLKDEKLKKFVLKGTNSDINVRFQNVDEMKKYISDIYLKK